MSEFIALTSGAEGRYAKALFLICKDLKIVEAVETDLVRFESAIDENRNLQVVLFSPLYSRYEQTEVVEKILVKMKVAVQVINLLKLMANKRRLLLISPMISSFRALAQNERGEMLAEITSVKKLTKAQENSLQQVLKKNLGKDVRLKLSIDEAILGGLVIKLGSKMIDTSIRSKLLKLQTMMKEVG